MGTVLLNIVFTIALSTVTYLYWRNLKYVLSSGFRAFDLMFLTLLFFLFFSRMAGVFIGFGTDYDSIQIEQFFTLIGGRFEYLTMLYAPIIAFTVMNISIEVGKGWQENLGWPVLYSSIVTILLAAFDLIQLSILKIDGLGEHIPLLIGVIFSASIVPTGLYALKSRSGITTVHILGLLFLQQLVIQVVVWIFAYISAIETLRQSILLFAIFIFTIWPILRGEIKIRRTKNSGSDQIRQRVSMGLK